MKKGYKVARQEAELADRRAEAFFRHIRGENFGAIAKSYGLSRQTVASDIRLVREMLQKEMREEFSGMVAESYAVYREVRTWAFQILQDDGVEMRERISAANLLIRAQQRMDKLTGADSPEKVLNMDEIPDITLLVRYPDGHEKEIVQEADVIDDPSPANGHRAP